MKILLTNYREIQKRKVSDKSFILFESAVLNPIPFLCGKLLLPTSMKYLPYNLWDMMLIG